MTYGLSKLKVARIVDQIERDYGDHDLIVGMTPTESTFAQRVRKQRGGKAYRSGWPDFLVHDRELGWVGVEVKSGGDVIRPSQRRMFTALESTGLRVFVWHDVTPDRLVPWRRFDAAKGARAAVREEASARFREGQLAGKGQGIPEKGSRSVVSRSHRG